MNLTSSRSNTAPAPLPTLAPLLELLVPIDVSSERAAAALLSGADVAKAAQHAIAHLRLLFSRLTANDLQLLVAGRADGEQWLTELNESARVACATHKANGHGTAEAVAAAKDARNRLVSKAFHVMSQARAEAERHESAAHSSDRAKKALVESLVERGLPREEVLRFVGERFGDDPETHRTAATKARQRAEAVAAYIDDPLRRLHNLDSELAAELQIDLPIASAGTPRASRVDIPVETAILASLSAGAGARGSSGRSATR